MRFESLRIENFLGIRSVCAEALGTTIIVAGQNGSGKSAIFEALRLLKSSYGGYQPGEWQQFFNERQIQLHGRYKNISGIFNDPKRSIRIDASIALHQDERSYIAANLDELITSTIWQGDATNGFTLEGHRQAQFSAQQRRFEAEAKEAVESLRPQVMAELSRSTIDIGIHITPSEVVTSTESFLSNLAFSNFRPREIGLIDYHGAQRYYNRESVAGINLNLQQAEQNYSQSVLYNYANKYNNVKSEMAANFVGELLAEHATGTAPSAEGSITASMKDLFLTFFPDKEFQGPRATKDGRLRFPVTLAQGGEHDIDDLSAGEKEILYGYLRMRSSAPKYSVVLIDEPELHLNPRLVRKLPDFYRQHLGDLLSNQLWLVTHSDALIREAVGKPGFNVFHMLPAAVEPGNQLRALSLTSELDAAVTDLVGDLAAYRPGGRCIILEGGGDLEFDRRMLLTLFSEELQGTNVICSADKAKVRSLHKTLEAAYSKGQLSMKFFAVTDRDGDALSNIVPGVSQFAWDVYHIENYLLEEKIVAAAANIVSGTEENTPASVADDLRSAAAELVSELVEHEVRDFLNRELVGSLRLNAEGRVGSASERLYRAALVSKDRLLGKFEGNLLELKVREVESGARERYQEALASGTWKSLVPGREILKKFTSSKKLGQYERFRNVLLSCMANANVKPSGMSTVVQTIRAS